jgi:phage baseplate assembly protein V
MTTMLKFGVVSATDPANCRVRVKYQDNESVESWWLAVPQRKTLQDKDYDMPDVGEHVACLIDEHNEEGVVVGAIYSAADATPVQDQDKRHLAFKDGSVFEYDRGKHRLTVTLPEGQARITIGKEGYIEIEGATVIILHDAADIDCRKILRLRAKEGIEQWTPSVVTLPYKEATIPENE